MKIDNSVIYFILLVQEVFKEPYRLEFDDETKNLWIRIQTKLKPDEAHERIRFCDQMLIVYHLPLEVNLTVGFL